MTERIIDFLDALVATVGAVDRRYCLVEKRADVNGTNIPYKYKGNGNYEAVNVDGGSVSYWRIVNSISFDVVDGNKAVKNLQANYPIRYVAMVRRDDTNPLTFSQDVANILEGRNKDLQTQLQAKNVNITVGSIDTDTVKIWSDEFAMPLSEPNYTRSMVMIELTVTVIAARSCWESCESFPDILRGFDWCNPATVARLTDNQRECLRDFLCGTPPTLCEQLALVDPADVVADVFDCLTEAAQTELLDSECVIPPCSPVAFSINSVSAESLPSGVPFNLIATLNGIAGGTYNPATDTLEFTAEQGQITVTLSDDTPILGSTITATVTPTGFTPTLYTFATPKFGGGYDVVSQVGNTFNFVVYSLGTWLCHVAAENTVSAYGCASATTQSVPEAVAYISAHETAASASMSTGVKEQWNIFYAMLKGMATPNESDVLTKANTNANSWHYMFSPTTESTAHLAAFPINIFDVSDIGTIENFLLADVSVLGLKGRTGARIRTGKLHQDFGQNDVAVHNRMNTYLNVNRFPIGVSDSATPNSGSACTLGFEYRTGSIMRGYLNNDINNIVSDTIDNSVAGYQFFGMQSINRPSSSVQDVWYKGNKTETTTNGSTTPSANNEIWSMGLNGNGSGQYMENAVINTQGMTPSFTDSEMEDFHFAIDYFNANILNGILR